MARREDNRSVGMKWVVGQWGEIEGYFEIVAA